MRTLLCMALLACCNIAMAAPPPLEARKIDFLIGAIGALHDAQFTRNGTAYGAPAAASHLRLDEFRP